jgi:hypothetical protein
MQLPLNRARIGLLAGVLGATGALTFVAATAQSQPLDDSGSRGGRSSQEAPGDISGPCDEAEHAGDPECAGVIPTNPGTTPTTPTTAAPAGPAAPAAPGAPAAGTHTLNTPGGTVTYRVSGGTVSLVSAMPAQGWRVEVEQSSGREVELDFRAGSRRVQVNLELEDGRVRERVRVRDDADDTDVRIENGAVVDDHGGDDHGDDHGGATDSGNSGPGSSGSPVDDNSGSGSGHSGGSDDSGSGHSGSDDSGRDDSGGGGRHSGGSDDNPHPEDD